VHGIVAPLLAGARVTTRPHRTDPPSHRAGESTRERTHAPALALLEQGGVSLLVSDATGYEALLRELQRRGRLLDAPVLQRCIVAGGDDASSGGLDELASLSARWRAATGLGLLRRRPHGGA